MKNKKREIILPIISDEITNQYDINIRNYGLGQIDNRNTAGTVGIQAYKFPLTGLPLPIEL